MYERNQVETMLKERNINLNLDIFPEFALAPAMVMINPEEDPQVVEGRFYTMVFANGVWKPLVEVSSKYNLVTHLDMVGSFVENCGDIMERYGDMVISPRFSANFGRMFLDVGLPKAIVKACGDKILPGFTLGNSVDQSKKLEVGWKATRLVCSNGARIADSRFPNGNKLVRHIGEGSEINGFLTEALSGASNLIDAIKQWEGWDSKPISSLEFTQIAEEIGFSENQTEEILNQPLRGFKMIGKKEPLLLEDFTGGKDSNFWKAYNAFTQFITDKVDNPKTSEEKSEKLSKIFEEAL